MITLMMTWCREMVAWYFWEIVKHYKVRNGTLPALCQKKNLCNYN